jgi:hypothetical protein
MEQGSYEWHKARQGIVSGTSLKSALGTPAVQKTLMYRLVSERMTEPEIDDLQPKAMVRGRELEPHARKAVVDHTGIPFQEAGMLFASDIPDFGCSPDAVSMDGDRVVGGLEIKCPDSKKHVEYLIKDELPSEYQYQVEAPFLLDDSVEWWIFASFDDRNYERPLFTKLIERSHFKDLDAHREKLKAFLDSVHEHHMALTF